MKKFTEHLATAVVKATGIAHHPPVDLQRIATFPGVTDIV